jgi:CheY-like chemotaxis protein
MGGDLCLLPTASGARFRLTLTTQALEDTGFPSLGGPAALPTRLADLRVLVVDDIATNRLVALAYLRLAGVRADEAAGGAEALTRIAADPPDLVLLDMNMPDMDGQTTLRHIRDLGLTAAALPVIAMTADATEDHRRRYLEAGLDGYLAKPLTPEAVTEVLARHLGGKA